uniref:Uncharacterized protein n=1 Tax=Arundo donax TaxID=35708 RepID=A0A0A9FQ72_ARUDO
MRTRREHL